MKRLGFWKTTAWLRVSAGHKPILVRNIFFILLRYELMRCMTIDNGIQYVLIHSISDQFVCKPSFTSHFWYVCAARYVSVHVVSDTVTIKYVLAFNSQTIVYKTVRLRTYSIYIRSELVSVWIYNFLPTHSRPKFGPYFCSWMDKN